MRRSRFSTFIWILCVAILCAAIAGCGKQAAEEPKAAAEPAKVIEEQPKKAEPAAAKVEETAGKGPGPYSLSKDWNEEPGFITNWLIAGPFPNPGDRPDNAGFNTDYLKNYGGEASYIPANGMEIKMDDGKTVTWQQYKSEDALVNFFDVPFLKLEAGQEDVLCYAACWIESDADKDAEIRVGSDDGYKLWLNNKEIGVVHDYRSAEMDSETYKVKLNKGRNLVLIKVDQDYGEFEFMLRVVNAEGKEMPGITIWN